jgi:hypothetical protein
MGRLATLRAWQTASVCCQVESVSGMGGMHCFRSWLDQSLRVSQARRSPVYRSPREIITSLPVPIPLLLCSLILRLAGPGLAELRPLLYPWHHPAQAPIPATTTARPLMLTRTGSGRLVRQVGDAPLS